MRKSAMLILYADSLRSFMGQSDGMIGERQCYLRILRGKGRVQAELEVAFNPL